MQPLQWCGLGRCGRMPLFAAITLLQMDLRKSTAAMNNQHSQLFLCDYVRHETRAYFRSQLSSSLSVPTSSME